ncbi:MAG: hypothetical protein EAZ95_18135 [Bacteroidetes bacterium]|nr:MAG: hypothetical protein EAZ95_18135 [Bacteroidota bacterium]
MILFLITLVYLILKMK